MKKLWKQGRGQKAQKQMREWKQVEDGTQGLGSGKLCCIGQASKLMSPMLIA